MKQTTKFVAGTAVSLCVLLLLPIFAMAKAPSGEPGACGIITRSLESPVNDTQANGEVKILQTILRSKGYAVTDPSGEYGSSTVSAVKAFQVANGITPQTGTVGPLTRAKLNAASCSPTPIGVAAVGSAPARVASSTEPMLLLTSQTGAEVWKLGESKVVTWSHANVTGKVTVSLMNDEGSSCTLGKFSVKKGEAKLKLPKSVRCSNTKEKLVKGTYTLNIYVPAKSGKDTYFLNSNSQGTVKITGAARKVEKVENTSANESTALTYKGGAFVTLTSQKTDERWEVGETYEVTWDHRYPDLTGNVQIYLSNRESDYRNSVLCGLGQADIAAERLSVRLDSVQCNRGGVLGGLVAGLYAVAIDDGAISSRQATGGWVLSRGKIAVLRDVPAEGSGAQTRSESVKIYSPVGVGKTYTAKVGQTVSFSGTFEVSSGAMSAVWDFGDGVTGSTVYATEPQDASGTGGAASGSHVYSQAGTYPVTLTMKLKTGASVTSNQIYVTVE